MRKGLSKIRYCEIRPANIRRRKSKKKGWVDLTKVVRTVWEYEGPGEVEHIMPNFAAAAGDSSASSGSTASDSAVAMERKVVSQDDTETKRKRKEDATTATESTESGRRIGM